MERPRSFVTWAAEVPEEITDDAVRKVEAYRLGLFLADLAWFDAANLLEERRSRRIADQLARAAGSIGANIEEGYSHRSGKERARYYTYSLGSARETRGWYFKGRHVFKRLLKYVIPAVLRGALISTEMRSSRRQST